MSGQAALAYARARAQARHGLRPTRSFWSTLGGIGDFALMLQTCREQPAWRPWLAGVGRDPGALELDQALKDAWCRELLETAGWMPEEWQPAIRWLRWLPELPMLQQLMLAGERPRGTRATGILLDLAESPRDARRGKLRQGPLASLAEVDFHSGRSLREAWQVRFRTLMPSLSGGERRDLRQLEGLATLATLDRAVVDAGPVERALLRLFRFPRGGVTVILVYLALQLLDATRLRGLLVSRLAALAGSAS